MASACLNTISPENLLDCPPAYSSYSWFNPRLREMTSPKKLSDLPEHTDPVPENSDLSDFDGFEFRLEDPVTMLPADELFSEGKLVPLQMNVKCNNERENESESATSSANMITITDTCPDTPFRRRASENTSNDVFSPRAPRCSSRWKELLGFGGNSNNNKRTTPLASTNSNANGATRSIRQLLQRNSKASLSSNDASVNVPLLDNEAVTLSSRASLSSSSSSNHSLDDLPRLSLDSDKPNKSISTNTRPKTRMVKTNPRATTRGNRQATRRSTDASETRAANPVTIDSPRMNSSGKIVFQHLERSSSSPSSLNGGPRYKHRVGVMERSYSANVRITPVLNVPVCSLRGSSSKSVGGVFGFPIFSSSSSQQNKQRGGGGGEGNNNGNVTNRSQRFNGKSKTDNGLGQC